jgi:hypothetical protein
MSQPLFKPKGEELRGAAWIYMAQAFLQGDEIRSNVKSEEQTFQRLTGFWQADLERTWKSEPGYTTCGDFVGHYTKNIGLGWVSLLNTSDPPGHMKSLGKRMAWVGLECGLQPSYGDIFKQVLPPLQHVGVSLECDAGLWRTAEGGQRKLGEKWDAVKRKASQQLTVANGIQGWVDIVIYQEFTEPNTTVPNWLIGVWEVSWPNQKYWYYFAADRYVYFTSMPDMLGSFPMISQGMGKFGVNATSVLTRWYRTGTVERFSIAPGKDALTGTVAGLPNPISAVKVDLGSVFTPFQM